MQNGFSVTASNFEDERLATSGARAASMPEGLEPATEIPIEYMYPLEGAEDVQARLIMECPMMRTTAKGIQPPKSFAGSTNGKPAVQVVFDKTNPEHMAFVGSFGNQYEYTEDDDGRTVQAHKNPVKATGCLGKIRDWCIYQYATYLASLKGRSTPSPKQLEEAEKKMLKKFFWLKRLHDDGPLKGQVDEDSSPMRYFKLMTYRPGTPEESRAKFCLPDGTKVDMAILYGRCFVWTPFLSFRRIFDGAKFSVTMEVTEAIINDFIEVVTGMPIRSSRLVERLSKENPDQAALVAEKYRLLQEGAQAPNGTASAQPGGTPSGKQVGVKVDDVEDPKDHPKTSESTVTLTETPVVDVDQKRASTPEPEEKKTDASSRRRPTLPPRKD